MEVNYFIKDKSKENSSVQAIIRFKGQRYKIGVGETVIVKHWNPATHRCRVIRQYPEASYINSRLDDWENIIEAVFNGFGLIVPTQKMVKDAIDKEIKRRNLEAGGIVEDEEEQYLLNFARKFKKDSKRSENTKKSYQTTINKIEEYEAKYKVRLRFIDIDMEFYESFKDWLLNSTYKKGEEEIHYAKNYIGSLFKNISKFMAASKKGKLHDFSGHKDEDFKVESEDTDAIYLNQDELEKIYNIEFTPELLIENGYSPKKNNIRLAIRSLNEERDRFLIGCYTALRHSDYSRLEDYHFRNELLGIWTVKKDKKVFVPMHYRLKEILERRLNILPKPISDQKHNNHIKVIGKLAGINDEVLLTKTRGGKRVEIVGPKYSFITSHTARRSGATNMYLAGIDIKFIQDLLGHAKPHTTLKYIKVSAENNAKRLKDHAYFTGKKEEDKKEETPK